jgi:hypothetical protein
MQGLNTTTASRATPKAMVLMVVGMTLLLAIHLCYTYPSLASWKIPTTSGHGSPQDAIEIMNTPLVEDELPVKN